MATIQSRVPTTSTPANNDAIWSDEEKREWLAAHGSAPTHVVTFEPLYQIELCIPPWEQPDSHIARSAVTWGEHMERALASREQFATTVVAAHHEGNSMEIYSTTRVQPRTRLRSVT